MAVENRKQESAVITVAELVPTQNLDALLIAPRDAKNDREVRALIERNIPTVRIRRTPQGLVVDGWNASVLLDLPEDAGILWRPEAKRYVQNRLRVKTAHGPLYKQVAEVKEQGAGFARQLVSLDAVRQLDDHQIVNVAAMALPDCYGLCVFDEQGAGKTVTFIFAFDLLVQRDQADFALILAPKSMVPEWPTALAHFKGDLYKVAILAGSRREKVRAVASQADVLVVNFETAVAMEAELRALLRRHLDRAIVVVDESFFIKNPDAQRTGALRRLREWCGRAYVLCGTPAPNAPHDLVEQFNFVDFGYTFSGAAIPEERAAARPVVQKVIESRGIFVRHLKRDVLPELPTKTFHKVIIPLQPTQDKLYRSVLSDFIKELERTDDLTFQKNLLSFLAKRNALLQICSNPRGVVDGYEETPTKLLALDSLLEELVTKKKEKVVAWSFYTASLDAIVKRYARFNPVRYDGSVTRVADRHRAVERFQEDQTTMLFVGNPAAAGAGLNLHRARVAVYESLSNQAAHYLQSVDRIHRRGQAREVEYFILLADRTIEVAEFERLAEKQHAAQVLLGDPLEPPVTRETMLREALRAAELIGSTA